MNTMNASTGTASLVKTGNASVGLPTSYSTPPLTPGTPQSLQQGGKRRVAKQSSKKSVKKQDKEQKDSKKDKKSKQDLKSKKEKKGGSFVADVNNLAVPFAILLAKEGLSKVFKKDEKDAKKSSMSAKNASKPTSLRRKSTLAGGSCNLGCGAMTGGRAARELFTLQKEIDNFLEKY